MDSVSSLLSKLHSCISKVIRIRNARRSMGGEVRIHFVQLFLHRLSLLDHEVCLHLISSAVRLHDFAVYKSCRSAIVPTSSIIGWLCCMMCCAAPYAVLVALAETAKFLAKQALYKS